MMTGVLDYNQSGYSCLEEFGREAQRYRDQLGIFRRPLLALGDA